MNPPFRGSLLDIRLFVAAYEERSFTAAAQRESSTQSGVSHHIRQLEDLLEVKLFVRDKAGVIATPAADLFYRHCLDVLRGLDGAANEVARLKPGYHGSFTACLIPALTHRVGAPALLRFAESHPNVKVRLVEEYSSNTGDLVASGAVDFALATLHGSETGVEGRDLVSAPEALISRAGAVIDDSINMVWPSGMEGRRTAIVAALRASGLRIGRELEIDSGLATIDLVARSSFCSVVPTFMIDPVADAGRIAIRPLPELSFHLQLLVRRRTKLAPEAETFVEMLVAEVDRATRQWEV